MPLQRCKTPSGVCVHEGAMRPFIFSVGGRPGINAKPLSVQAGAETARGLSSALVLPHLTPQNASSWIVSGAKLVL